MKTNFDVILVNLISEDYLTRYQAPLAVNTLAAYFYSVYSDTPITTIDMQDVFEKNGNNNGTVAKIFRDTVKTVISEISVKCAKSKTIVGLSVKWGTQEIAGQIISQVRQETIESQPLFIIGNVGSTHGYHELLRKSVFLDVIAVIGEGEKPLAEIFKIAQTSEDFKDTTNYKDIPNVAINNDNAVHLSKLQRMDLSTYPIQTLITPAGIYDKKWDVYAIETSRGCP